MDQFTPKQKLVFTFSESGQDNISAEWVCPRCDHCNTWIYEECEECGEPTPNLCEACSGVGTCDQCVKTPTAVAKTPVLVAWRCTHCKTYNDPTLRRCSVCKETLASCEAVWKCPGCGDYNSETDNNCVNCKYDNPGTSKT
ncbi:calpain-15-like [Bolinopsis microptera]|uniref:calpain-15-like n=1 Tax=Bolinopsis microptera TaxID=2820187 RepID=UPI003079D46C